MVDSLNYMGEIDRGNIGRRLAAITMTGAALISCGPSAYDHFQADHSKDAYHVIVDTPNGPVDCYTNDKPILTRQKNVFVLEARDISCFNDEFNNTAKLRLGMDEKGVKEAEIATTYTISVIERK